MKDILSSPSRLRGSGLAAAFVADGPTGDAEVIIFPPHSSERMSLASFAKTPNLNEHLLAGVFLFSDDSGAELLELLKEAKKDPDAGLILSRSIRRSCTKHRSQLRDETPV